MAGITESCLNIFKYASCIVLMIVGGALTAVGIYYRVKIYTDFNDIVFESSGNLKFASYGIIVLGSLLVAIAVIGCCGACNQNSCLSLTFAGVSLLFFIAQLCVSIYILVKVKDLNEEELRKSSQKHLTPKFENYFFKTDDRIVVDLIQKRVGCCGLTIGPEWWTVTLKVKPPASCKKNDDTAKGCDVAFAEYIPKVLRIIAYILIGSAILGLVLSFLNFFLATIKPQWTGAEYTDTSNYESEDSY